MLPQDQVRIALGLQYAAAAKSVKGCSADISAVDTAVACVSRVSRIGAALAGE